MTDILKPVADACSDLTEALTVVQDQTERNAVIKRHIDNLLKNRTKVGDFEVGLEWFNTGEPLSLGRQLKGKVVVLDFFTYCCINCMHVLPYLRELEHKFTIQDGVVVVGVHSAKFDNERDSSNISAALRRYNVQHPVVNDKDGILWSKLKIPCWPTLLILGPQGDPLFQLIGEGHENALFEFVQVSLDYFRLSGVLSPHILPPAEGKTIHSKILMFPGKVACVVEDDGSEIIAISNTGLHTIVIATKEGTVKHIIGGTGEPDFKDGTFSKARFNAPQGVVFYNSRILFVADTENHAIRKVDLEAKMVLTVAGDGSMGSDMIGGQDGPMQQLSSPWDVCIVRRKAPRAPELPPPFLCICPTAPPGYIGPDIDHSPVPPAAAPPMAPAVAPLNQPVIPPPPPPPLGAIPGPPPPPAPAVSVREPNALLPPPVRGSDPVEEEDMQDQDILIIAMAGCHQIWGLFFQNTIWWRGDYFHANTCGALAGSGKEENRNNSYPRSAGFAQPSGVTYVAEREELLIADSESSSIRCVEISSGKVTSVVGANRCPDDLFCFGDIDGVGYDAKLQHPLGVAWDGQVLYVADSYNHKIRAIDLSSRSCTTLVGSGRAGSAVGSFDSQFNEPGGLCVSADKNYLYVADTNNHCIKVVDTKEKSVRELDLTIPVEDKRGRDKYTSVSDPTAVRVKLGGKVNLKIHLTTPPGVSINVDAPQRWEICLPNTSWSSDVESGLFKNEEGLDINLTAPTLPTLENVPSDVVVKMKLYLCVNGSCQVCHVALITPVVCDQTAPNAVEHRTVFDVPLSKS